MNSQYPQISTTNHHKEKQERSSGSITPRYFRKVPEYWKQDHYCVWIFKAQATPIPKQTTKYNQIRRANMTEEEREKNRAYQRAWWAKNKHKYYKYEKVSK